MTSNQLELSSTWTQLNFLQTQRSICLSASLTFVAVLVLQDLNKNEVVYLFTLLHTSTPSINDPEPQNLF